ncbi:MAG: hypothetical protein KDD44_11835, partial [Bdellovibrionales bacterium]|nr:hypothetical protein [Bdellovibrionales bacterium]
MSEVTKSLADGRSQRKMFALLCLFVLAVLYKGTVWDPFFRKNQPQSPASSPTASSSEQPAQPAREELQPVYSAETA